MFVEMPVHRGSCGTRLDIAVAWLLERHGCRGGASHVSAGEREGACRSGRFL
ncbi:hypothetical protein J31TS4_20090 [Paenibacillus sp. J31TS4]|nr:hypothetical protein J31TS4_20090 [Paenibacillus sp. J31TS4]